MLTKHGSQTITGKKFFKSNISILGDLFSSGLIDNTNIYEAYMSTMLNGITQNVTGYKEFNTLNAKSVELYECEYDCPLLNILQSINSNVVHKSNIPLAIKGMITFVTGLNISGNATVKGFINDILLPYDLMIQGQDQTVLGTCQFLNNLTVKGNATVQKINSVNISEVFEMALRKSGEQNVTGVKIFIDSTIFNSAVVNGTVNGIYTNEFVLSQVDQTVNGVKTFSADTLIDSLSVGSMTVDGLVDGINLTYLESELVKMSGNQIVKGIKLFESHVSFNGNFTITGLIDGVNLTDLAANAMRTDGNQVVTGVKVR